MRAAACAAGLIAAVAALPAAAEIVLALPIDCRLGQDCYIQQYMDHARGRDASDYRCGPLTYNTHKGTDFALPTRRDLDRGVNVLAAAPGTVRATRDGMQDKVFQSRDSETVDSRECGNAVVIDHADGWTTQYCHLARGSVSVRSGDAVRTGDVLGRVGLSGITQFPHVHLTVRKDGTVVDPFDPDGQITCGAPSAQTLWSEPLPYQPGGLLDVGFADAVPEFDAVKAGEAARTALPRTAPAIVVFGYAFGAQAGDRMRLAISGPQGELIDQTVALERTQAQLFRAIGKRLTADAWPAGTYRGTVTLLRRGQSLGTRTTTVTVR